VGGILVRTKPKVWEEAKMLVSEQGEKREGRKPGNLGSWFLFLQ
jgi:hypothetical protein